MRLPPIAAVLKRVAARGFFQRTEKRTLWLVRELDEPQLYGRYPLPANTYRDKLANRFETWAYLVA